MHAEPLGLRGAQVGNLWFSGYGAIRFAQPNKKKSCEDAVIWGARRINCYSETHRVSM